MSRIMLGLLFAAILLVTTGHRAVAFPHESTGQGTDIRALVRANAEKNILISTAQPSSMPDLSGEWEILEVEDDKRYKATLDKSGNGPYSQQGGRFTTTKYADRLWQGTWQQSGNDREGGFEILLAEDGTQAKGRWWYSRVGSQKNIPPREHGGTYQWKRLTPAPTSR